MPTTDLAVVNGALDLLGVAPIGAIGEDSVAGGLAARTYADLRDELLQSHPWGFATKRVALVELAPPADTSGGFTRRFQLPDDYLRVVETIDQDADAWKVEERELKTSVPGTVWIRYIAKVTQPGLFSAGFVGALRHKLATEWAETLTKSSSTADRVEKKAEMRTREARSFDGQEGSIEVIESRGWVEER